MPKSPSPQTTIIEFATIFVIAPAIITSLLYAIIAFITFDPLWITTISQWSPSARFVSLALYSFSVLFTIGCILDALCPSYDPGVNDQPPQLKKD